MNIKIIKFSSCIHTVHYTRVVDTYSLYTNPYQSNPVLGIRDIFCTDPDTAGRPKNIRILRIRIGYKCGTLVHLDHSSKIKSHKEVTKQ
jgi:hypothetical protein